MLGTPLLSCYTSCFVTIVPTLNSLCIFILVENIPSGALESQNAAPVPLLEQLEHIGQQFGREAELVETVDVGLLALGDVVGQADHVIQKDEEDVVNMRVLD